MVSLHDLTVEISKTLKVWLTENFEILIELNEVHITGNHKEYPQVGINVFNPEVKSFYIVDDFHLIWISHHHFNLSMRFIDEVMMQTKYYNHLVGSIQLQEDCGKKLLQLSLWKTEHICNISQC